MVQSSNELSYSVVKLGRYLTSGEACELLRISAMKLYELIADEELVSFKTGTRWLIETESVLKYVEKCKRARQVRDPRVDKMIAGRQAKRAEKAAQQDASSRPKLPSRQR